MIIFLIGYMGSGKTKTGQLLAKKMSYEFIDTDRLIEISEKQTVSEIFNERGELAFRELEHKTLESLSLKINCVVSTGGGLPCFFDNMDVMNRCGITVYLKVPAGMLVSRLLDDKNKRPLLAGLDENQIKLKVNEQLAEREIHYGKAKLIFPAANMDLGHLAAEISKLSVR